MGRTESRAKYDKLVSDLMESLSLVRHIAPAFRADLQERFYDLIEEYIRDLDEQELDHITAWGMPYEGWPDEGWPDEKEQNNG